MFNTAKKQIPTCPSIKQSPKQSSKLMQSRATMVDANGRCEARMTVRTARRSGEVLQE